MARPGRQVAWATSSEPKSNAGVSTQMMQTSPRTSASVVLRATKNSVFWDRRAKIGCAMARALRLKTSSSRRTVYTSSTWVGFSSDGVRNTHSLPGLRADRAGAPAQRGRSAWPRWTPQNRPSRWQPRLALLVLRGVPLTQVEIPVVPGEPDSPPGDSRSALLGDGSPSQRR